MAGGWQATIIDMWGCAQNSCDKGRAYAIYGQLGRAKQMQVRRFGLWWVGVWLLGGLLLAACAEAAPAVVNSTATLAAAAEFEPFYTAHGGLRTFGYPLTDSFVDPGSGRTVQYFQNLRLEVNPGMVH